MSFNDFPIWVLRSPFYRLMGGQTLLITVTGRKSGKPITLPVNFQAVGYELWITSHRSRQWWRNLRSEPRVRLRLRGQELPACGTLVVNEAAVEASLAQLFKLDPRLAKALHVRMVDGAAEPADLRRAAAERVVVKISL